MSEIGAGHATAQHRQPGTSTASHVGAVSKFDAGRAPPAAPTSAGTMSAHRRSPGHADRNSASRSPSSGSPDAARSGSSTSTLGALDAGSRPPRGQPGQRRSRHHDVRGGGPAPHRHGQGPCGAQRHGQFEPELRRRHHAPRPISAPLGGPRTRRTRPDSIGTITGNRTDLGVDRAPRPSRPASSTTRSMRSP